MLIIIFSFNLKYLLTRIPLALAEGDCWPRILIGEGFGLRILIGEGFRPMIPIGGASVIMILIG